jgi:hypothetical protein
MSETSERKVLVSIDANADGLTQTLSQANAGLNALGNNPAPQSLRAQLREATQSAQQLLLAGKQNTEEYRNQARVIAELRDAQDVFNRTIPDAGNALQGVSKAAQIVSGSVSALSGVFKSAFPEATATIDVLVQSLGGVSAAIGLIDTVGDVGDVITPYIEGLRAAATANNILNTSAEATTAIQGTSTIALLANAAATNIATAATVAYNFVLNKIPLFAIITAVGLVIAGFIKFKDSIFNLLPGLERFIDAGKQAIQFLTDLVGITSEASRQSDAFTEAIKKTNTQLEYQNKLLTAKGGNERLVYENSRKILDNTISDLKLKAAADDEYNAKYYESLNKAIQDRNVLDAKETKRLDDLTKKRADDAAKADKAEADKLKAKNEEAAKKAKALADAKNAELKKALTDARKFTDDAYVSERALSEKAISELYDNNIKTTTLKYGEYSKQTLALVEAKNIAMGEVDTKYNEIYEAKVAEIRNKGLDEFDKKVLDIYANFDKLIKADPTNKDKYVKLQTEEVTTVRKEQTTTNTIKNLDEALGDTKLSPSDREALENEKLIQQYDAGIISKQKYEADKNKIEADASKARKDIDDAETATKQKNLEAVSNFLSNAASLAGESTIAGKGLAVASATISTYLSAQKAYESLIGIPFVGPTLAPIAAGVAVASGLASIKKIVSVKVPTTAGTSSGNSISTPSFSANSAPVINSTQLQNAPVQDVRVTSDSSKTESTPIRTYVVYNDIETKAQQDAFNYSFSQV